MKAFLSLLPKKYLHGSQFPECIQEAGLSSVAAAAVTQARNCPREAPQRSLLGLLVGTVRMPHGEGEALLGSRPGRHWFSRIPQGEREGLELLERWAAESRWPWMRLQENMAAKLKASEESRALCEAVALSRDPFT